MSLYQAYGLVIRSDVRLPSFFQLSKNNAKPGLTIRVASRLVNAKLLKRARVYGNPKIARFYHQKNEILVVPNKNTPLRVLQSSLISHLPIAYHQRKNLVLHASVVGKNSHAVAFLGASGMGKSTLAAALCSRGYQLVSDDAAVLKFGRRGLQITPTFPSVKIWPDAARWLGAKPENLSRVHLRSEKRYLPKLRNFHAGSSLLEALYVINNGRRHAIRRLTPKKALLEIMRHNVFNYKKARTRLLSVFFAAARVANQIPVFELERPVGLRRMAKSVRLLQPHMDSFILE